MAQLPTVPHLDEAYSLAQFLAPNRAQAVDLVLQAFEVAGAADRGRFAVLRGVARAAGGFPDDDVPGLEDSDADPLAGFVEGHVTADLPFVGVQAGRDIRNRLLPLVLGTLPARDRAMIWFSAAGIAAPADLARILDTTPETAGRWMRSAQRALVQRLFQAAALPEKPLLAAAESVEPAREAVRRILDALTEPVPVDLHRRMVPPEVLPPPVPPTRRPSGGSPLRRTLLILALIVTAAVVGYGIQGLRPESAPTVQRASDAARRAIAIAADAEPDFRTSSAEQAEVFVRDRIGWQIVTPIIDGHPLTGVAIVRIDPALEVPVLFFAAGADDPVVVVTYTYAFLDRAAPTLYLDRDLGRQIAEPGRFGLLDAGRTKALVFRNRDDIFVAVTTGDAGALQDAIAFPD